MPDVPVLYVATSVVERFRALPARPWETGGWLLGYWSADRSAVFVTHATPPGPRGTPWGVRISGKGHRRRFDEAWTASCGLVTFTGDWHTHPGSPASPSRRDENAARQLAKDPDFRTPKPVVAIVSVPRTLFARQTRHVAWYLRMTDVLERVEPRLAHSMPAAAAAVRAWRWPCWRRP